MEREERRANFLSIVLGCLLACSVLMQVKDWADKKMGWQPQPVYLDGGKVQVTIDYDDLKWILSELRAEGMNEKRGD